MIQTALRVEKGRLNTSTRLENIIPACKKNYPQIYLISQKSIMATARPFRSISLQRDDDPNKILKAFSDRNIFVLTREVYLPMTDGVCRPIPCRMDNYEDHYPLKGVGIYKNPGGRPVLFAHHSHTEPTPFLDREDSMTLASYREEFNSFWNQGEKLARSLSRLRTELREHFKPVIDLAEQTLHYDLHNYGLSLGKNRQAAHRKLFRQIVNSEVDFSPCLRETFRFVRKIPLQEMSRSKNLWPLRHALSTIQTFLRCLSESMRAFDIVMDRIKDIMRWAQDHGHKPEFQSVVKGSPIMLDQFHAEGWYTKLNAFFERCDEEWQAEKHGEATQKAVSQHSERSIVHGLSRKLSSDTLNSLSVAKERERRPYARTGLSGLARKISMGNLRKSADNMQRSDVPVRETDLPHRGNNHGEHTGGDHTNREHRVAPAHPSLAPKASMGKLRKPAANVLKNVEHVKNATPLNGESVRGEERGREYRAGSNDVHGASPTAPQRTPEMTSASTRRPSMANLRQVIGAKLGRGK